MIYFDSFDICEAYWLYYCLWHRGGLTRRCYWQGRGIATQLSRMHFHPAPSLDLDSLSENGRAIYDSLVAKYEGSKGPQGLTDQQLGAIL